MNTCRNTLSLYIVALTVIGLYAINAPAAIVTAGTSTSGFGSLSSGVPDISSTDYAESHAVATTAAGVLISGFNNTAILFNGAGGNTNPPANNTVAILYNNGTDPGIIRVDLGAVVDITSVATYTAHNNTRTFQFYELWGSNNAAALPGDVDATLIASINAGGGTNFNGYRGVLITPDVGEVLASFQYLLFNTHARGDIDANPGTTAGDGDSAFFHEIDINVIPTPAALSAGMMMLGVMIMRRRHPI